MSSQRVLPFERRHVFLTDRLCCLLVLALIGLGNASLSAAGLLDRWLAQDLSTTLNDGDPVVNWTSSGGRIATASAGAQPTFKPGGTPAGNAVVQFNGDLMTSSSPVGGRSAFSVALVFKANTLGAGNNVQWWGKTGLVDAEQPGVQADWGTVLNEAGQVGIGTGGADVSTYSANAPSVVDGSFHVAVFTWGGGSQAVYVDTYPANVQSGVATAVRNNAGIGIGGILTGETDRRLNGDVAEIQFYDAVLSASEVANLITALQDTHLYGNRPVIRFFRADQTEILIGDPVTLSWSVTNATSLTIEPGVGNVGTLIGSTVVSPPATTTYQLTASNSETSRTAQVTVQVDPVTPNAFGQSLSTPRNQATAVTLAGLDPQGLTLTYLVTVPPQHGLLSGTPPNVVYQPAQDYSGPDQFVFVVTNGVAGSPPATVAIDVVAPAEGPTGILLGATAIDVTAQTGALLARLSSIDVNPDDTHTYTLLQGAGVFSINGDRLLAAISFGDSLGVNYPLRIRTTDSTGLSYEADFLLPVVDVSGELVINEIHYNPDNNTVLEEFVELHNPAAAAVQLDQWRLSGGIDFAFPAGQVIQSGGYLVIAQDPPTLQTRYGVAALGPYTGQLGNEGEQVVLRDPFARRIDEVDYRVGFPWPIASDGDGGSMQLINPALDNDLGSSWRALEPGSALPLLTPGAPNSVFQDNAAPNIRQVNHQPQTPTSADPVLITAKVTDPDGVASVTLSYQVVSPGQFIPSTLPLSAAQLNSLNTNPNQTNAFNPDFEAPVNWTTVTMHDDGLNGDAVAGDGIYTVSLFPRGNRVLVRYRISCADTLGASHRAPFADDPSLNFAYFVYDGVPDYQGFSSGILQTLPVYTLVTRDADLNECAAWYSPWASTHQLPQDIGGRRNEGRLHFNWEGAVVYDGVVYDHVKYRLRGANGRYHPGKRNFRIRFNDGHHLAARDQRGTPYPVKWRELTTGKGQSNRGSESFALNELVNFYLWNKVGVPAPAAFHFHFRVIRGQAESPADPYAGDFWGLNWAQEKYDVGFLESHDLPRGNLYKLVDNYVLGVGEQRYQAPFAVTNAADFFNIENVLSGLQSIDWLKAHANYTNWYRYFAIAEAIRHYDTWPSANKNGAWYFEPIYTPANGFLGRLMQLPYDSTDTWGPTWNNGQDVLYNGIFPSSATGGDAGQHPEMQLEYRNVVREIRDLLFQPDQINAIIDAHAGVIWDFAQADYARWYNALSPASYRSLFVNTSPGVTGGLPAYVQDMKNFMFAGGNNAWWIDRQSVGTGGWVTRLDEVAADVGIPNQPTLAYVGPVGYPLDRLTFQSSAFSDPQGSGTFAAIQWRVAEVLPPGTTPQHPSELILEWDAAWDSGPLPAFNEQITLPAFATQPGRFYRARVRHLDNTGRWSRWSNPHLFVPSPVDLVGILQRNLTITEIMYNPPGTETLSGDHFEFLELRNKGTVQLDLSGLFFSQGIDFVFPNNTRLAPGQTFLLGRDPVALAQRYPGLMVDGVYGGKLDNSGETLTLTHPQGSDVLSVRYNDRAPWPITPDGFGFSLVLDNPAADPTNPAHWRASSQPGGSPGADNPPAPASLIPVVINEILTSSTPPEIDAIELLNPTGAPADLSGWYLTDEAQVPYKFRIPDGTTLAPGQYVVFYETQFNNGGLGGFALSSLGEEVYLFSADTLGNLTGYTHGFDFGAASDGVPFGRHLISTGAEHFPPQSALTLGQPNAGPLVGPVVISEIMYHPPDLVTASNVLNDSLNEFIELYNLSHQPVPLFDPNFPLNTWQLRDAVSFVFPTDVTLPAQGYLLVVGFDPVNDPAQLNAFRSRYGVNPAVPILGPYAGNLNNAGEAVELDKPEPPIAPPSPDAGIVPLVRVDRVNYSDEAPWPSAADGTGASLQRWTPDVYGNDPAHWVAAWPNAGGPRLEGVSPVITLHPENQDVPAGSTVTLQVAASGPNIRYQWRFNDQLLVGSSNATLVLANVQPPNAGLYHAVAFNEFGSAQSDPALLNVAQPPFIVQHPQSVEVDQANPLELRVVASGLPPITYQWFKDGLPLLGATADTLVVSDLTDDDTGDYAVEVRNGNGSVRSRTAQVLVLVRPAFVLQPLSQEVVQGRSVTFSVQTIGTLPMGYRWRKNFATLNSEVLNSRAAYLTLTNVQPADGGTGVRYSVVLTNKAFFSPGILSSNALLTVLVDTDHDGMPDSWETQHGFNPNDPGDALLDQDTDGSPNGDEYVAGTDPGNPDSYLRVERLESDGTAILFFGAAANRTYTVQYKNNLDDPAWQKLADVPARDVPEPVQVSDPEAVSTRFYRLVTPRQP